MDSRIILLVEDNPDDVELTLRALKKHNVTNEVVVLRDGQQALDYLLCGDEHVGYEGRELPAVILLDLKLPNIDGLEVLQQLRADERTKLIPVVVITSSKEQQDMVSSYELGANSFVRKPVEFGEFAEAVRQLGLYWLLLNEPLPPECD